MALNMFPKSILIPVTIPKKWSLGVSGVGGVVGSGVRAFVWALAWAEALV